MDHPLLTFYHILFRSLFSSIRLTHQQRQTRQQVAQAFRHWLKHVRISREPTRAIVEGLRAHRKRGGRQWTGCRIPGLVLGTVEPKGGAGPGKE